MMMTVAAVVLVLLFLMMMTVAAVVLVLLFLMMMAMAAMVLVLHLCQGISKRILAFHSFQQLRAGELIPRRCNQSGLRIVLTQQCNSRIQLGLRNIVRTGKDDGACGFDLIVIEFTKILHVDLNLGRIRDRNRIPQSHLVICNLADSGNHIRKLANAGGLDDDPVGLVLRNHLIQCLAEITDQRTANTAGVHFRNVDACILQETAVNADLTKLILDENKLFALIGFRDHFFDQRGFTRTQEAGINIDFHIKHLLLKFYPNIIAPYVNINKAKFHEDSTVIT